ncbi:calcium:proton antiporter [Microbacterium esteraromaticum]|uniref:calcium:proton antiporter n=1 Tax=Microbacterium esteraromaticum TaxID=57043 RepID=UPI0019D404A0|nr:calcium:proton antiporter [Microbacterium esteraromaticum]MBN7792293.1 calcium:proton antiporter [Microbacterium esteraromaticum]
MFASTLVRTVLTPVALLRLGLGWGLFGTLLVLSPLLTGPLPAFVLWPVLLLIITVITVSAFGVVTEAEHLARRLGDPYGTLVLTLSIVLIEVILISAVLLGPGEHPTIARDSVMAVSMIILNLVAGTALMVGGLRHGALRANGAGVSAFVAMLVVLLATAFAFPALIGSGGTYTPAQAIPVIVLTLGLYVFFLVRQMGAQRGDFQEIGASAASETHAGIREVIRRHRGELIARTLLLIATLTPIVLLSHDMATLLDDGLERLGAPVALSGILIAMIVFLPETITAIRAAHAGELQRVSNLCHGALVSTVGLTIPVVLAIGMLTGRPIILAESPAALVLLGLSMLLTIATFLGRRTGALHGAAHLMLFVMYALTVFA